MSLPVKNNISPVQFKGTETSREIYCSTSRDTAHMASAEESVKDTCYAPEVGEFELQVKHTGRGHGRPNSDTRKPKAEVFDVAPCSVGKQERCT